MNKTFLVCKDRLAYGALLCGISVGGIGVAMDLTLLAWLGVVSFLCVLAYSIVLAAKEGERSLLFVCLAFIAAHSAVVAVVLLVHNSDEPSVTDNKAVVPAPIVESPVSGVLGSPIVVGQGREDERGSRGSPSQ